MSGLAEGPLPPWPDGTVVTVGSFDGVHVGHRAVLDENLRRAAATGRPSVLLTFEPHPLAVLRPAVAPPRLTTAAERAEVVAATGVDALVAVRFDRRLAALPPERFVERLLLGRYRMRELVIGYDHGFGRDRAGGVATLEALAQRHRFGLTVVPAAERDGLAVSSSKVRLALGAGDLDAAAAMLGRRYAVHGVVVRGDGRGRQLGVPTVNLGGVPPDKLLPPDGVYAAVVECRAGRFGAMVNQGARPTFGDGARGIEAHLFGFDGDLYGQPVRLAWVARLRGTRRFASVEELRQQLAQDGRAAREALARAT